MSRVVITTWDGGGNTHPALNLGARLGQRGHEVVVLGWSSLAPRVEALGLELLACPPYPAWPAGVPFEEDWDLLEELLQGEAVGAEAARALAELSPDVVVVDCFQSNVLDAAFAQGLPTVGLVHVSYQQFLHVWGDGTMNTDISALLGRCEALLALQPPGFDEPCERPPHHVYVGPVLPPGHDEVVPEPLARQLVESGPPWVLLSLSTTSQPNQLTTLRAALDQLATLPVRVLVTLGGPVQAEDLELPPNATAVGYVPHELLLPSMSAVVTHAGMTTVAVALAAGVPMVCVPLGRDQGGNAQRVQAIGAGLVSSPDELSAAVQAVLGDTRFSQAARRVAALCSDRRGGELAVRVVEGVAARQRGTAVVPA